MIQKERALMLIQMRWLILDRVKMFTSLMLRAKTCSTNEEKETRKYTFH